MLKTAAPGITHKSDATGVVLGLGTLDAVAGAYEDLSARLGPRVLVQEMVAGPAVEMILGMVRDEDFGPILVIGSGGIHAEVLADVVYAKPPIGPATARRLVDRLKLRALLGGVRGRPPADMAALCETIARFSVLAASLGTAVGSIDVNPLLVRDSGCIAVDALVVPASQDALAG